MSTDTTYSGNLTYEQWKQWVGFFVAAAGGDGRVIPARFFKRYWRKGWDAMSVARQYLIDLSQGKYLVEVSRRAA